MLNLWNAEWLKTRRRPATLWTLGTLVIITAAFLLIVFIMALAKGKGSTPYIFAQALVTYPNALTIPAQILQGLGVFIGITFAANTFASEYSRDTWKMILPRRAGRVGFLVIKLLMSMVFILITIVCMLLVAQLLGWLGGFVFEGSSVLEGASTGDLLLGMIPAILETFFYITLTMLAVMVTRSTVGGIVASLVTWVAIGIIPQLAPGVGRFLPTVHLNVIAYRLGLQKDAASTFESILARFFDTIPSATTSILVVLGYVAVFIGASMWLFKQRDMAGS